MLTRRRKIIEIVENLLIKVLKLKQQRLIINLKFTNFDIYYNKSFKKFKNWTRNAFNAFEINFLYFFSKWIKISWVQQFIRDMLFQRWNNNKKYKNHIENVIMKELLELFNLFHNKFVKSTFDRCIKVWCNETKLITERKRLCYVCRDFKDWSRRIHFDSIKKSSFQSIEKRKKEKFNVIINMSTTRDAFATLT